MSNQPTDPHAADDSIDDLDLPAEEAEAVTGGIDYGGEPREDGPQGQMQAI